LLFIAVLAGADSYRKIARFMDAHRLRLNAWLALKGKRAPAHTAIRYAFLKLSPAALEAAFRARSSNSHFGEFTLFLVVGERARSFAT
jgi:hypothetical protein